MLAFGLSTVTKNSIPQSVERRQAQKPQLVGCMEKTTFGQRLKLAFNNAKNAEIARKIGVGETAVTNYLAGRVPDAEKLIKIRQSTNCDLNWLLTGEEPTSRKSDTFNREIIRRLATIAKEQAQTVFGDVQIGGENIEHKTLELLMSFVLARGLTDLNLIEKESDVLSLAEIMLAQKFSFAGNKTLSLDESVRQMIMREIAGKDVSQVAQRGGIRDMIRELVQEEIANGRKARLIHMDFGHGEDEEDIPRQKAG